jgi:antitoxin YefM
MSDLPISEAQPQLQQLIDQVVQSHKPILIRGEHSNAILLAEEDWSAIQETLYLLSIPGMRESIKTGLATPIQKCDEVMHSEPINRVSLRSFLDNNQQIQDNS